MGMKATRYRGRGRDKRTVRNEEYFKRTFGSRLHSQEQTGKGKRRFIKSVFESS